MLVPGHANELARIFAARLTLDADAEASSRLAQARISLDIGQTLMPDLVNIGGLTADRGARGLIVHSQGNVVDDSPSRSLHCARARAARPSDRIARVP